MKILDTRELNERLEELEAAFNEWKDSLTPEELTDFKEEFATPEGEELSDEEFYWMWETDVGGDADELKNLIDLREEIGRPWGDGVGLIREKDFTEYAQLLAEDIGAIDRSESWPCNHIDWERAANDLMMDYSSVDYDGETYYYRE